ncbi:MAG: sialidase family protein [Polyangiales bacterium]
MVALAVVATVGCTGELSGADPGATPHSGTGGAGVGGSGNVGGTGPAGGGTGGDDTTTNPTPGTGGRGGAGGGEPVEPPAGSIPMFVAQGHAGRTTVSCDDGHTWVADKSNDDSILCFEEGFDCDHDAGAGRGITWGDGWFYATFGWGTPGDVRRSDDGVDWETVLSGTTFGGVAYGNGRLVAANRPARYSDDQGVTWMNAGDSDLTVWTLRGAGFAPTHGGRFVMAASGGIAEITVSADGHTWSQPESSPADCGDGIQTDGGIVYRNGTIVAMGSTAVACRSTDGGATWTSSAIGGSITSQLVFSGGQFMVWGNGTLYRSTDGVTWTTTPLSPANLNLGPVAVSDSGTFVGVKGGWLVSYDKQAFYRSADGVTWETLPGSAFDGSHPIRFISFGYGKRSAACPD